MKASLSIPHRAGLAFFLVVCALLWRPTVASAEEHYIMNPGFEEAGAEELDGWKFYLTSPEGEPLTQGSASQNSEHRNTGGHSVKIIGEGPSWAGVYQIIKDLEPGAEYKLTLWAKANLAKQSATVSVLFMSHEARQEDNQGKRLGRMTHRFPLKIEPTGAWQEFSTTFTVPSEASDQARLDLRCMPKGQEPAVVWYDDISLQKVDSGARTDE